ncbi:MAG: hypothetical protein QW520_01015 [Methanomassiliicoccales archaeon]
MFEAFGRTANKKDSTGENSKRLSFVNNIFPSNFMPGINILSPTFLTLGSFICLII